MSKNNVLLAAFVFLSVFFLRNEDIPSADLAAINGIDVVTPRSFEAVEVGLTCLEEQVQRMHQEIEKIRQQVQHMKHEMVRQTQPLHFSADAFGTVRTGLAASDLRVTSQGNATPCQVAPIVVVGEKTETPIEQKEKERNTGN